MPADLILPEREVLQNPIQLEWQVYDLSGNVSLILYLNGTIILDKTFYSNDHVFYDFQEVQLDTYNITVVMRDFYGNTRSTTTWISVKDLTAPKFVSFQPSLQQNYTVSDNETFTLYINAFDRHPSHFYVYVNDTLAKNGSWNNQQTLTLEFSNFPSDVYNISVVIEDESLNRNSTAFLLIIVQAEQVPAPPSSSTTLPNSTTESSSNNSSNVSSSPSTSESVPTSSPKVAGNFTITDILISIVMIIGLGGSSYLIRRKT